MTDQHWHQVVDKVRLYLSVTRFDAAEKLLKTTIADDASKPDPWVWLGYTYHRESRFPEAIDAFARAVSLDPTHCEAALNLALTLADVGRYPEAADVMSKLSTRRAGGSELPLAAALSESHAALAALYFQSDKVPEGLQELRKAAAHHPRDLALRVAIGKEFKAAGQNDRALEVFESLVKEDPALIDARVELGFLYTQLGRKAEAQVHWSKVRDMKPDLPISRALTKIMSHW